MRNQNKTAKRKAARQKRNRRRVVKRSIRNAKKTRVFNYLFSYPNITIGQWFTNKDGEPEFNKLNDPVKDGPYIVIQSFKKRRTHFTREEYVSALKEKLNNTTSVYGQQVYKGWGSLIPSIDYAAFKPANMTHKYIKMSKLSDVPMGEVIFDSVEFSNAKASTRSSTCVIDAILTQYENKDPRMCWLNRKTLIKELGRTPSGGKIYHWCKQHNITCVAFGPDNRVIKSLIYQSKNHYHLPLYYKINNGHFYVIDDAEMRKQIQHTRTLTNQAVVTKWNANTKYSVMTSFDVHGTEKGIIIITDGDSLSLLLDRLIIQYSIMPEFFNSTRGVLTAFKFKNAVFLHNPDYSSIIEIIEFHNKHHYNNSIIFSNQSMGGLAREIIETFISIPKSIMSGTAHSVLGPTGCFGLLQCMDPAIQKLANECFDCCRSHYHILKTAKFPWYMPTIQDTLQHVNITAGEIHKHGFYYLDADIQLIEGQVLGKLSRGWYPLFFIKEGIIRGFIKTDAPITAKIIPSRVLRADHFKETMRIISEYPDGKKLVNFFVGTLHQVWHRSKATFITNSTDILNAYICESLEDNDPNDLHIKQVKCANIAHWQIVREHRIYIPQNNRWMFLQIISAGYLNLQDIMVKTIKPGMILTRTVVDSVALVNASRIPNELKHMVTEFSHLFELPEIEYIKPIVVQSSFINSGRVHAEANKPRDYIADNNELITLDKPIRWRQVALNKANCIYGRAGTGKTHFIINTLIPLLEKENNKWVITSPTHRGIAKYKKYKPKVLAAWIAAGRNNNYKKERLDTIIIDEFGMMSLEHIEWTYIQWLNGTRIIFVGDMNQLAPVNGRSITFSQDWFHEICEGKRHKLVKIQRYDKELAAVLNTLLKTKKLDISKFKVINEFKLDTRKVDGIQHIAHFNKTRIAINEIYAGKLSSRPLDCIPNLQFTDMDIKTHCDLLIGDRLIIKNNKLINLGFTNNQIVTITHIAFCSNIFIDECKTPFGKNMMGSLFKPAHCITVYGLQGADVNNKIYIHDLEAMSSNSQGLNIVYTALSRATKLSDITLVGVKKNIVKLKKAVNKINQATYGTRTGYVYQLVDKNGKPYYVGCTFNCKQRAAEEQRVTENEHKNLYDAIKQYGYKMVNLWTGSVADMKDLERIELQWIHSVGALHKIVNIRGADINKPIHKSKKKELNMLHIYTRSDRLIIMDNNKRLKTIRYGKRRTITQARAAANEWINNRVMPITLTNPCTTNNKTKDDIEQYEEILDQQINERSKISQTLKFDI